MLISINRSSEQKAMVTVMRVDAKKPFSYRTV